MALRGLCVIEMAGLAPAPFCGMLLSDFGARVVRIDRPGSKMPDFLDHGKESVAVNLKTKAGLSVVRTLCEKADVLIEPYRPGVMEKLGLGPKVLMAENPKLIYARLTGYGQSGSMAHKAGHDINYIAMSGVLSKLGRKGDIPHPPINLLADFAGGGLLCCYGILAALLARNQNGKGQVIDSSMLEGSAYVGSWLDASGGVLLKEERGTNLLDGGSAFYNTYETKDGQYVAVGAIEPQFYAALLKGLGLENSGLSRTGNQEEQSELFAKTFRTKTRDEWTDVFKDLDACVTPVLNVEEAANHEHNKGRESFKTSALGQFQAHPSPRLSLTKEIREPRPHPDVGEHNKSVLLDFGFSKESIQVLNKNGAFGESSKL